MTGDQPLGVPYGSHASTCPVRALRAYRQPLLDHGDQPTGSLFVRIGRHGRINPPMYWGSSQGEPTSRHEMILAGPRPGGRLASGSTLAPRPGCVLEG
ncbi:hypothetical protein ACFW9N_19050 [Streptomyces sp. NPDC059496]|uniref:hypothetical protein n=1 Tax=Streptomyces sp. NPDC059496 TaxID=3346851 RepID=UPI0036AB0C4E